MELKFRTEFDYGTAGRLQMFKVKGQGHGVKVCQIMNNSAGDCSILIKLTTDYDHMPPDLPNFQGQRVKGQGYSMSRLAGIKKSLLFMNGCLH